MASPRRSLSSLALRERARVVQLSGERFATRRLMEMGLIPGVELEVIRRAPMGDPVEIRLRGYSLSLRGSEAAEIEVEVIA